MTDRAPDQSPAYRLFRNRRTKGNIMATSKRVTAMPGFCHICGVQVGIHTCTDGVLRLPLPLATQRALESDRVRTGSVVAPWGDIFRSAGRACTGPCPTCRGTGDGPPCAGQHGCDHGLGVCNAPACPSCEGQARSIQP